MTARRNPRAARFSVLDDVIQGHVLELGPGDKVVQVVHIGGMVLVMMELQGLGRDVGLKRILGVRKFRQFVCHDRFSLIIVGSRTGPAGIAVVIDLVRYDTLEIESRNQ